MQVFSREGWRRIKSAGGPVAVVVLHLLLGLAFIAGLTFACFRLGEVNATTAGFAYLIAVLLIAASWGLAEATVASIAAMLCLNYYFLPPVGTFTIAESQNWVALFAFLGTATVASQLSARAKKQTRKALDRQRELERLYALSRAILLTPSTPNIAREMAREIARTFDLPGAAVFDRSRGEIHRAGPADTSQVDDQLRETATQGTQFQDQAGLLVVTAVRLGGQPIGSLAVKGAWLSDTVLQSLSNLVAVGLERVRAQESANRADAARQSEELKSTLLDAIAHEFKTPLTSIKAATSAVLADSAPEWHGHRELVTIIDEEADRLDGLVTQAIQMARVEAGELQLHKGLHSVHSLVSTTLQQMRPLTQGREIRTSFGEPLPPLFVDAELIRLALRQLLDNALKYADPGTPIRVRAVAGENGMILSVSNQGPGIPELDQSRIFDKFYRGASHRQLVGSGMGLTIAREILRAHGGDISVKSSPGLGSEFYVSLPVPVAEGKIA